MTTIRKFAGRVIVPRETLIDLGLLEPTPEEQAERDAWRVEYEQRKQAAAAAWPVFLAALAAVTDPVARAVLDLHKADKRGECTGCDFGGYEGEHPEWPCRTVEAVAAAVGITVPPDLDMVVRFEDGDEP